MTVPEGRIIMDGIFSLTKKGVNEGTYEEALEDYSFFSGDISYVVGDGYPEALKTFKACTDPERDLNTEFAKKLMKLFSEYADSLFK